MRMIGDSRESSLLMGAWRRDEFCSLRNRWQNISSSNANIHYTGASLLWKDRFVFTWVTLLEYLKQLHPVEWDGFVKLRRGWTCSIDRIYSVDQTRRVVTRRQQIIYLSTALDSRVLHLSSHQVPVSGLLFTHKRFIELFLVWWTTQIPLNCCTVFGILRLYSSLVETQTSLNVSLNVWRVEIQICCFYTTLLKVQPCWTWECRVLVTCLSWSADCLSWWGTITTWRWRDSTVLCFDWRSFWVYCGNGKTTTEVQDWVTWKSDSWWR